MIPIRFNRLVLVLTVAVLLLTGVPGWAGGGGGGGGHGGGGGGHGYGGGGYGHGGYGYGGYGHGYYGLGGYGWGGWGYGGYGWGGVGLGYGWGYPAYGVGYGPAVDRGGYTPATIYAPGFYYSYPGFTATNGGTTDGLAHVSVKVPTEDAVVWFNGQRMSQTGNDRQFKTPPITPGQNYSYEIRARWMENGKPIERTQTILIHANQQVNVDLANPAPASAQVARFNVMVPTANAEVWLNGQHMAQTGTDRQFQSPPIPSGQNYSYEFRARWMENGKPVERTETVTFQAGKEVNVNLSKPVLAVSK